MVYPFTRMVIYGTIWYQGEANRAYNTDKYNCTFPKMIEYWRQTWHERTNGTTDLQFPFGFVQVNCVLRWIEKIHFPLSIVINHFKYQ